MTIVKCAASYCQPPTPGIILIEVVSMLFKYKNLNKTETHIDIVQLATFIIHQFKDISVTSALHINSNMMMTSDRKIVLCAFLFVWFACVGILFFNSVSFAEWPTLRN